VGSSCTHVTNVGLQHLSSLTALNMLYVYNTFTTQAGRNALETATSALSIYTISLNCIAAGLLAGTVCLRCMHRRHCRVRRTGRANGSA
jgi:hypothetical protein